MANQYGTLAANPPSELRNKPSEATLDQVNIWMRSQPWWSQIRGGNSGDLTKDQRQKILRAAQAAGVHVDEGDIEVDKGGNFNPKGHKLRNTLIVAGIAGATIATMGAAGAFSGAAAGGGAASSGGAAAAAGGVLPSTGAITVSALPAGVAASGAVPAATAIGAGTAAAAVPTAASIASGAAPGAAGAGKGVASWLKPALEYAVPVAGQLYGTKMAADAQKDAAKLQAEGLEKALDFEKQQYADLTTRLDPWVQSGTSSTDRMSQLLGLPARANTTATAPPTRGPAVRDYGAIAPEQPRQQMTAAPEQMVKLQAPDGSVMDRPASELQHWLDKGARRVA